MQKDLTYFAAREIRARELAGDATDIAVRIAHLAAATGYAERIVMLKALKQA